MNDIPLSVPNLNIEIVENLRECVETGWVSTGGRFIREFEEKVAKYVNIRDAVACQSGTAGLHTALRILGVEPDDEVIVPTLTFIAAVNPVKYLGAFPVFMDCDDYLCMETKKVADFCEKECTFSNGKLFNKHSGRAIKAIVPVHIFGNLVNMEAITDIANRYNLKVLEDATEAMGSFWSKGEYKGRHAGTAGDMGVFSFNANKIITTGGGGMIVSIDDALLDKARYLTTTAKDDALYFIHDEIGYNYRMLNIQAALGVSQISELPEFIKTKQRNYQFYKHHLDGTPGVELMGYSDGKSTNHWFYSLLVEDDPGTPAGEKRNILLKELIGQGIQCRPVWRLAHKQKPYESEMAYKIEKAEYYELHIINIPCSTNITECEMEFVCDIIKRFCTERT